MIDLEKTVELTAAAVWPNGVSPVHMLPPGPRPPARDPVVQAALVLLADGYDRLAIVRTLADKYPRRSSKEVDQVLRETAVHLLESGVVPA